MSTRRSREYPIWCVEMFLADDYDHYTTDIIACFEDEEEAKTFIDNNQQKYKDLHAHADYTDLHIIELAVTKKKVKKQ